MINKLDLLPAFNYCLKKFRLKDPPKLKLKYPVKENNDSGICVGLYCFYDNTITISKKINKSNAILTLFHEFIHCHQYNTNKLKIKNNILYWKNKKHSRPEDSVEKISSPWEIEADYKSNIMYNNYIKNYESTFKRKITK